MRAVKKFYDTVVVSGSRNLWNDKAVRAVLDQYDMNLLVVGEAEGVDQIARAYAFDKDIELEVCVADWSTNNGGCDRNQRMANFGADKCSILLAFLMEDRTCTGTLDMISRWKFEKRIVTLSNES